MSINQNKLNDAVFTLTSGINEYMIENYIDAVNHINGNARRIYVPLYAKVIKISNMFNVTDYDNIVKVWKNRLYSDVIVQDVLNNERDDMFNYPHFSDTHIKEREECVDAITALKTLKNRYPNIYTEVTEGKELYTCGFKFYNENFSSYDRFGELDYNTLQTAIEAYNYVSSHI